MSYLTAILIGMLLMLLGCTAVAVVWYALSRWLKGE